MKFDPIDFSALHDCAAKMKIIIKPTLTLKKHTIEDVKTKCKDIGDYKTGYKIDGDHGQFALSPELAWEIPKVCVVSNNNLDEAKQQAENIGWQVWSIDEVMDNFLEFEQLIAPSNKWDLLLQDSSLNKEEIRLISFLKQKDIPFTEMGYDFSPLSDSTEILAEAIFGWDKEKIAIISDDKKTFEKWEWKVFIQEEMMDNPSTFLSKFKLARN